MTKEEKPNGGYPIPTYEELYHKAVSANNFLQDRILFLEHMVNKMWRQMTGKETGIEKLIDEDKTNGR